MPDEVRAHFAAGIASRGRKLHQGWEATLADYKKHYPELAREIEQISHRELPTGWDAEIAPFPADAKGMASRASSGKVLNQIAKHVPWLLGGSADLAPSNNTALTFDGAGDFSPTDPGGRNFHFGIREHSMAAIASGMALSGLRPYVGTFFVFSDYMRPSVRLAALMGLPVIYIYTHDFDRGWRGWADPSAYRASGRDAGNTRPDCDPSGRRQRGRRGLSNRFAP